MSNFIRLFTGLAVAGLVACATTKYYWQHGNLGGQAAAQQLVADRGACTAAAYQAIGAPPLVAGAPSNRDTTFSGYTSSGTYFYGQTQSHDFSAWGPAASIQADREMQYRNVLANVFMGCMAQRGWTLQAVMQ